MSYSFGIQPCPAEEMRQRLKEAAASSLNKDRPEEVDRDIEAAIAAAEVLAASLTEDDGTAKVTVSISGHANAGREPPAGWSSDSVYVSVARVAEAPAPPS
jgi:hypothetical protein